jgi:hypothetical protein
LEKIENKNNMKITSFEYQWCFVRRPKKSSLSFNIFAIFLILFFADTDRFFQETRLTAKRGNSFSRLQIHRLT